MKTPYLTLLICFVLQACTQVQKEQHRALEIEPQNKFTTGSEVEKFYWNEKLENIDLDSVVSFNEDIQDLEVLPLAIFRMKNLTNLTIGLFLEGKTLQKEIGSLSNLDTLVLGKSKIRAIPSSIGQLKKLKLLVVAGGGRLNAVPSEIGNCTELKEVNLWRNALTTLPEEIKNLKKLDRLNLIENDFSEAERLRIKKLLPNCIVKFDY